MKRIVVLISAVLAAAASAQKPATPPAKLDPPYTLPAAKLELIELEGRFAADVARNGGKAFAHWFAEDGIELSNGRAPVRGLQNIVADSQWSPAEYQLNWVAEDAGVGPSGDTGFTFGHFTARYKDKDGKVVTHEGRYITFWKRVNGAWKVALDAGADDVPGAPSVPQEPKP